MFDNLVDELLNLLDRAEIEEFRVSKCDLEDLHQRAAERIEELEAELAIAKSIIQDAGLITPFEVEP